MKPAEALYVGIVYIDRVHRPRVFAFAKCRREALPATRRLVRGMFESKLEEEGRDRQDFVCIEHRSDEPGIDTAHRRS